jgi:hypothetical protein
MATVLEQIRALDEQKARLLESAKQEALQQASQAIELLNQLGFAYHLVEGEGSEVNTDVRRVEAKPPTRAATGTRRTGIRDQVLSLIKDSDGVARADIIETLGGRGNKSLEQSVSNALSALKKAGSVDAVNGVYKAT